MDRHTHTNRHTQGHTDRHTITDRQTDAETQTQSLSDRYTQRHMRELAQTHIHPDTDSYLAHR